MIKPCCVQFGKSPLREADGRGDEVGVQPGIPRARHQINQIPPRSRLASRQMQLQHAKACGLTKDVDPEFRRNLLLPRRHFDGIGAIGARQGAAIGQLRQHGDGCGRGHGLISSIRRSIRPTTYPDTSSEIRATGAA